MNGVTDRVRRTFQRQVASPPPLPDPAGTAIARARRLRRRRRTATGVTAVVVAVTAVAAGTVWAAPRGHRPPAPASSGTPGPAGPSKLALLDPSTGRITGPGGPAVELPPELTAHVTFGFQLSRGWLLVDELTTAKTRLIHVESRNGDRYSTTTVAMTGRPVLSADGKRIGWLRPAGHGRGPALVAALITPHGIDDATYLPVPAHVSTPLAWLGSKLVLTRSTGARDDRTEPGLWDPTTRGGVHWVPDDEVAGRRRLLGRSGTTLIFAELDGNPGFSTCQFWMDPISHDEAKTCSQDIDGTTISPISPDGRWMIVRERGRWRALLVHPGIDGSPRSPACQVPGSNGLYWESDDGYLLTTEQGGLYRCRVGVTRAQRLRQGGGVVPLPRPWL
jgi:hypothetical protein